MRTQARFLALAAVAVINCVTFAQAATQPDDAVRSALATLDTWLGSGATAEGWSSFLKLPALRAELGKGDQADLAALEAVEKQLQSDTPGLERPRFVALREALENWTDELAIRQAPSLSQAVLQSEANFRPITAADVTASKAALVAAAGNLGDYLSGSNGAAWKKYLQWPDLEAQLKAEKPDLEVLAGIYRKLTADQVGLELPIFANTADAIERYVNDVAAQDETLRDQFVEQLKGLSTAIEQYAKQPGEDSAIDIGTRLGWLESRRQVPTLIRIIRSQLSRPNLQVVASERLVGAGIEQPLDEVTPVRDYILGTSIRGDGHMVGKVTLELVPSDESAMFDTMLSGVVSSRTVGQNGPATIYSNGSTAVAGRKRIVINDQGFASYPATAAARTATQVTGIGGSGMVQRVASRRVGEQKSQGERIAADHAADRVRSRMDKQINDQMAEAHANFHAKVRNPLLRRRELPDMKFRSTTENLLLDVLAANRNQIAAPGTPPAIDVENDLAVQVHESMINNLATSLLGGVTLEEEELQKRVVEMRGSLPDSLKSDEERDPWSITFARNQPVSVKFTENALQITIRGQRYTSGDQDFRAMNVTANYKIELGEPDKLGIRGIKLMRQGDLEIVPPGEPRRLSGREITLRTLLQKRFGKLFEPEVVYDGLILPGRWRQAGILDTKQLAVGGGWIAVAWLESGVPAPPEEESEAEGKGAADRVTRSAD
jgi:hypothetical protein